jgi:hypothetical protein
VMWFSVGSGLAVMRVSSDMIRPSWSAPQKLVQVV